MQTPPTPTRRPSPRKRQIPTSNSLLQNPAHTAPLESNRALSVAQGIHPGPSAHPLTNRDLAALPNSSTTPFPVHSPLPTTPTDGCALRVDAPGLKLLPRTAHTQKGRLCRSIRHKYAEVWSADRLEHRRGRPSLTRPPSPAFHRIRGFCAPSHSPNIERAVKEAIRLVPRLRRATHQSDGVCHSLPEADR